MSTSIAVLTPSRGRPDRLREMVDTIRATADEPVTIYVGLDLDDCYQYPEIPGIQRSIANRLRLADWCNTLAHSALTARHEIIAFLGDDHRPRTAGWDTRVRDAMLNMGPGLVYCADGLQNERLPTAPFWHARVIRALGWYYPPALQHLYADDAWLKLARDLGRCTYLPDVLIEHMHPSAGKAEEDESYRESGALMGRDREAFRRFVRDEYPASLLRVAVELGLA